MLAAILVSDFSQVVDLSVSWCGFLWCFFFFFSLSFFLLSLFFSFFFYGCLPLSIVLISLCIISLCVISLCVINLFQSGLDSIPKSWRQKTGTYPEILELAQQLTEILP